jgi:hypothetical protein
MFNTEKYHYASVSFQTARTSQSLKKRMDIFTFPVIAIPTANAAFFLLLFNATSQSHIFVLYKKYYLLANT